MRGFGRMRWLILTPAAVAGMFAGHCLDYWIVSPNALHRRTLLEMTGHGYLPAGARLAVLLAVSSVVASLASGMVGGRARAGLRWQEVAPRLAIVQSVGFVALEVLERVAAHASLSTIEQHVLVVGTAAQVGVAVVAAVLLALVHRTGAVVAGAMGRALPPPRAPLIVGTRPHPVHLPDQISDGPRSNRGPPLLLQFV